MNSSKESKTSYHTEKILQDMEETSFILKVSLKKIAVLFAGNIDDIRENHIENTPMIQMLTSALVMFQSVEDHDMSGNKTFHISIKDYSISVNSQFQTMPPSLWPPIIGPLAIDFRSVYATENSGVIIRKEVSITSGALKSSFELNDFNVMAKVVQQLIKEVQTFKYNKDDTNLGQREDKEKNSFLSTTLNFQLQPFSFLLMRYCSYRGFTCPFLDVRGEAYGKLEGCAAAFYGECKIEMSLLFFSNNNSDWEHVVEPTSVVFDFEQQPNRSVS